VEGSTVGQDLGVAKKGQEVTQGQFDMLYYNTAFQIWKENSMEKYLCLQTIDPIQFSKI